MWTFSDQRALKARIYACPSETWSTFDHRTRVGTFNAARSAVDVLYVIVSIWRLPERLNSPLNWLSVKWLTKNCKKNKGWNINIYVIKEQQQHYRLSAIFHDSPGKLVPESPLWILSCSSGWWRCWWELELRCVTKLPPVNQCPAFTGRMSFVAPTNSVKALKGKSVSFHGLAHSKLTWSLPSL